MYGANNMQSFMHYADRYRAVCSSRQTDFQGSPHSSPVIIIVSPSGGWRQRNLFCTFGERKSSDNREISQRSKAPLTGLIVSLVGCGRLCLWQIQSSRIRGQGTSADPDRNPGAIFEELSWCTCHVFLQVPHHFDVEKSTIYGRVRVLNVACGAKKPNFCYVWSCGEIFIVSR